MYIVNSINIFYQIVLTTYNSKTYKIDEIAWERSPLQTFPMRDGSQCSFIQYYEDVCLSI